MRRLTAIVASTIMEHIMASVAGTRVAGLIAFGAGHEKTTDSGGCKNIVNEPKMCFYATKPKEENKCSNLLMTMLSIKLDASCRVVCLVANQTISRLFFTF